MLKKRLVGVVTVKDGLAVQSFGYDRYLPLGRPEYLVENLDRWGVDEILLQVIDRSINHLGPDFGLLKKIGRAGLSTPLIYSGGVRSLQDCIKLTQLGADRIAVDALLHDDILIVKEIARVLGSQALILCLPVSIVNSNLAWFDYRTKNSNVMPEHVFNLINFGVASEVILVDWIHDGKIRGFDNRLIEALNIDNSKVIAFGGISEIDQADLLLTKGVQAVAMGNFLSYKELAVQKYKEALQDASIRAPVYASAVTLGGL